MRGVVGRVACESPVMTATLPAPRAESAAGDLLCSSSILLGKAPVCCVLRASDRVDHAPGVAGHRMRGAIAADLRREGAHASMRRAADRSSASRCRRSGVALPVTLCATCPPTVLYWPECVTPVVRCTVTVTVIAVMGCVLASRTCSSLNHGLELRRPRRDGHAARPPVGAVGVPLRLGRDRALAAGVHRRHDVVVSRAVGEAGVGEATSPSRWWPRCCTARRWWWSASRCSRSRPTPRSRLSATCALPAVAVRPVGAGGTLPG